MKIITTILSLILLISCNRDNVLNLEQEGYIEFTGSFPVNSLTSKSDVPDCSAKGPVSVYYRLINEDNLAHTETSSIIIEDNIVTSVDQIIFPVGKYLVDEISLLAKDGTVTHTVPNITDPRYNFAVFVSDPLPFSITIEPQLTTKSSAQVLCYSNQSIDIPIDFEPDVEIIELETLYFYIPENSCVDTVTVQLNLFEPISINITDYGMYEVPIPKTSDFWRVNSYINDQLFQSFIGTDYNADDNIDQDDVIYFNLLCN